MCKFRTKGNVFISIMLFGLVVFPLSSFSDESAKIQNKIIENNDNKNIYTKFYKHILTQEEREWLKQHNDIRLGIDPAWPPFEYFDDNKKSCLQETCERLFFSKALL